MKKDFLMIYGKKGKTFTEFKEFEVGCKDNTRKMYQIPITDTMDPFKWVHEHREDLLEAVIVHVNGEKLSTSVLHYSC